MPFDPDDLNKKNNAGKGQNKSGNDDFINSSFAVQFKPGDKSNTVSDKLKEGGNDKDDFDSFKDEFDDFEIDDTFNAFKPLETAKEPAKSPFSSEKESPKAEPEKKAESDIPAFPKNGGTFDRKPSDDVSKGPDKSNTPVFGSEKGNSRPAASQKKDEKLFNSGKDLDYATSEHDKNQSPFANPSRPAAKADKKPEVKTYGTVSSGVNAFSSANILDEIPEVGTENKSAPSPFVIRPTPSPKPNMPKANASNHQAPNAPKAPDAHTAPASAKASAEKNERPAHTAPAAAKAFQSDKSAPAAPHTAPASSKAAKNERPANSAHTAPASAKAEKNEKPAHTAPASAKASAEKNEKEAPAANKQTSGQRPGEAAKQRTTPVLSKPAPTGAAIQSIRPEDPRRMLAVEKSQKTTTSSHHEKTAISPVDTVKTTSKKKRSPKAAKDPGIGGVITLAVIIVAFIGILLILQNIDKIGAAFGRKPVETLPTIQTTTTAATTVATTTAETTTEATTESTTEATTEETTTEATTEETTTEATTVETTAATTKATKRVVNYGIATKKFNAKIGNFRTISNGFKYDITMTNKSGKTASFKKSLKYFSIALTTSPNIKSMSSNYLSFKHKNGSWIGSPKTDCSIKAGGKLTITVTVKTYGACEFFAYRSYNFKYN